MSTRLSRIEQVERNRAALLAAARRVFLARGYGAASLDAIAEEAGFSKGVIYSQFDSKADLFLALLDERIVERAAENRGIAARQTGRDGVIALLRRFEADATREAGWAALLVEFRAHALRDPAIGARYAKAHERTIAHLGATLQDMLRRAGLRPAMPPRAMAQFVLALGAGMTLERAADPAALSAPETADAIARALIA